MREAYDLARDNRALATSFDLENVNLSKMDFPKDLRPCYTNYTFKVRRRYRSVRDYQSLMIMTRHKNRVRDTRFQIEIKDEIKASDFKLTYLIIIDTMFQPEALQNLTGELSC